MKQTLQAPTDEAALLARTLAAMDAADQAAAKAKAITDGPNAELEACKVELEHLFRNTGRWIKKGGSKIPGLTVYVNETAVAKVDSSKFEDIQKWAVESGNGHILKREIKGKAVEELNDSGVALPDGLSVDYVKRLGFSRSSK